MRRRNDEMLRMAAKETGRRLLGCGPRANRAFQLTLLCISGVHGVYLRAQPGGYFCQVLGISTE